MVGLIYLGSILALTFLIGLGQRAHHADLDGQQVFRFPRVLVTTLKVCIAVPGVLGIAVYQNFPRPGVLEATFCYGFFGALTLIVIASYYRSSRFSVAVGTSSLTLHTGSRSQEISLSGVRRLVVKRPCEAGATWSFAAQTTESCAASTEESKTSTSL
jgi:hypothetical protein